VFVIVFKRFRQLKCYKKISLSLSCSLGVSNAFHLFVLVVYTYLLCLNRSSMDY